MIWSVIFIIALSKLYGTQGMDLNALPGRRSCYPQEQPNCNENFVDVYPYLSESSTGMTKAETWFLVFTQKNKDKPENLHKCGGKLPPDTNFNPANPLCVIFVPFTVGYCDVAIYREWIQEILKKGDYNILLVDYSWGNHLDVGTAEMNIKIVANQTYIVLRNIQEQTGITKDQCTLIGHSLGAQVAALVAQKFPVKRITAIDPAQPGYDAKKTPPEDRLDMGDADFVDSWLCNVGKCLPNFATPDNVGHVNYYINGGRIQTACYEYAFKALAKGDFIYGFGTLLVPTLCFHAFCAVYYKVSINHGDCQFVGLECDSYLDFKLGRCGGCGENGEKCMIMGFDGDKYIKSNISYPRIYHVEATKECPYCKKPTFPLEGYSETYESSLKT